MTQEDTLAVREEAFKDPSLKDGYSADILPLLEKAKSNPRKREFKPIGTEERDGEKYFRMLNALDKDSYAQPHMHPNEACFESFRSIHGKAYIVFFSESGLINNVHELDGEQENQVVIPPGTFHTVVAETDCVLLEEMKQPKDGYRPERDKKDASGWSPSEIVNGAPNKACGDYLAGIRQGISVRLLNSFH